MDDEPQQPQEPDRPRTVPYWHDTGPATPMVLLLMGGLTGMIIAIVFTAFVGVLSFTVSDSMRGSLASGFIAIAWLAVVFFSFRAFRRHQHEARHLPREQTRRYARFFSMGFLLGVGATALLEGTCFSASAISAFR